MGVIGRRVVNFATILIASAGAGLWFMSKNYGVSAIWALVALIGLGRTIIDWNKPPADLSTDPLRTQLFVGVVLAGTFAWLFFNEQ
jgi:hypothetical protein